MGSVLRIQDIIPPNIIPLAQNPPVGVRVIIADTTALLHMGRGILSYLCLLDGVGFCPGEILSGGIMSGGIMSRGILSVSRY